MIDKNILEEINLKVQKIAREPEAYDARKRLVSENLRSIGDIHSFWIENPNLRKALLQENRNEETLKKEARKGIQAVHNGWYYLSKLGEYGGFIREITPTVLKKLNLLVEFKGDVGEPGEFRQKDVTLNIPGYTPPSWERVPEKVDALITKIKETHGKSHLEAAILTHLGIAAIQPFAEGNKRCARLLQDRILYDAQLPPATIPAGEGQFYFDLLSKTVSFYRDNNPEGQKQFYDYCASKVNDGLDLILDDLDIE